MRSLIAAAAAVLLLPTTAHAAAFVNGGFESGTTSNPFTTVTGENSTTITGWTVPAGSSVDYIGNYWQAQEGARSVDLNGNAQGGIQQTFDTVINQMYTVSFWLAGNPDGAPTIKDVLVGATGTAAQLFSFDSTGATHANMGWKNYTYNFTATSASTTLSFASQNATAYGAVLDNVSVSAVPEPATWAMMLFGFALVGGAMRRRTKTRPANHLSFA